MIFIHVHVHLSFQIQLSLKLLNLILLPLSAVLLSIALDGHQSIGQLRDHLLFAAFFKSLNFSLILTLK